MIEIRFATPEDCTYLVHKDHHALPEVIKKKIDDAEIIVVLTRPRLGCEFESDSLSRIVTWAKFQDIYTDQIFFHFNTHFDHRGEIARQKSAELILSTITKLNTGRKPVLVAGDFNARPDYDKK